jgi:hypothetical protein
MTAAGGATVGTDLPRLNTRAWLRLPCCGAEHPTRIEDLDGESFAGVAAPIAPHQDFVAPEVAAGGCFLGWVHGDAAMECAVELVGNETNPVPLWRLRPISEPTVTQRRSYVRFEVSVPIELYLLQGGAATPATTLNVSEGGVRCTVDKWAADPSSRAIRVSFALGDATHDLSAQVVWWGPLDPLEKREVGIKFLDAPPASADAIRRWVFAAQLEERRRGLS